MTFNDFSVILGKNAFTEGTRRFKQEWCLSSILVYNIFYEISAIFYI